MFGLMTKRAHFEKVALLDSLHKAQVKDMADRLNEAERKNRELDGLAAKFMHQRDDHAASAIRLQNRVDVLRKDNEQMASQIEADARYVEVGKARLAALAKQNEQAKAKRRSKAKLPDGVFEHGNGLAYTCKGCDRTIPLEVDVTEFDADSAYCGGSPRCLP